MKSWAFFVSPVNNKFEFDSTPGSSIDTTAFERSIVLPYDQFNVIEI
jgi:hypothetical protein